MIRARSIECRSAVSAFTKADRAAKADRASRSAWQDEKILIVSVDHPALDFAEREMVKLIAKRIGADR